MLAPTLALLAGLAVAKPQDRTDEASEAQITDATTECTAYNYAPVAAMAASFPDIWVNAKIVTSDADAMALFNSLNASIPNIAPKGTPQGDFSSVTPNYNPDDPDCWWSYSKCVTPKAAGVQADVTKCMEPNTWGLTYDDGPNCSHNAFYDYLAAQNQKATLYYIGSNVMDWPLEAQRGLADGHELCAHTWSHPYMTALSNDMAFAELYYSKKAIKDVVGVTVQCWRPPFGDVDDRIRYIAQALGMETVIWEDDTFDWNYAAIGVDQVQANYNDIIAASKNGTFASVGTIVLSHELDNETMTLAMNFHGQIKEAFDAVVPVAVCNNNTKPYVEQDVEYPNFADWMAGTTTVKLIAPTATDAPISIPLSSGATASVTQAVAYSSGDPGASNPTGTSSSGGDSSAAGRAYVLGRGEMVGMAATAVGVMAGWSWIAALV